MKKPKPDFFAILKVLAAHKVDFIVVGGVSAVLQGAPIATFDLDVVHSREPTNIERLIKALQELGAYYRGQETRRIEPSPAHLESAGHQMLLTAHHPCSVKADDLEERGSERATSSVLIALASNCEKEETPWPDDSLSESARS